MNAHVLIVDCSSTDNLLTRRQFVWPVQRYTHQMCSSIHLSKLTRSTLKGVDVIIFSGSTLKDNRFVKTVPKLKWLKHVGIPMLGICAGHELLGLIFGGKLKRLKQPVIGIEAVHIHTSEFDWLSSETDHLSAYHLNGNEVTLPPGFTCLGHSSRIRNEMMVHSEKRIMGFQFHPEYHYGTLIHSFVDWALNQH